MRSRTLKSSLDDWLSRGTNVRRFWKLIFYFFSRFILFLCLLHYTGVAYPQIKWVFPGPASELFWACCILFTAIFAAVFYVVREKREASGDGTEKPKVKDSPRKPVEEKREARLGGVGRATHAPAAEEKHEGRHGSVGRATFASDTEEKREGRLGGVGRATFSSEPDLEEQRREH